MDLSNEEQFSVTVLAFCLNDIKCYIYIFKNIYLHFYSYVFKAHCTTVIKFTKNNH